MHFLKLQERGWSRSIHKTSTWTIGGNKSVESTELQDSSSDEEATRRLALAQGQSNSFLNLQKSQDSSSKTHLTLLNTATNNNTSKSPGQRSNASSPLNNREEHSDQLNRSTLSIISQCSRLSPSPTSPRSRINRRTSSNEFQIEQHVSFEDEINDEKSKKFDDINETVGHKSEFNLCDQLKSSQVQSSRCVKVIEIRE